MAVNKESQMKRRRRHLFIGAVSLMLGIILLAFALFLFTSHPMGDITGGGTSSPLNTSIQLITAIGGIIGFFTGIIELIRFIQDMRHTVQQKMSSKRKHIIE